MLCLKEPWVAGACSSLAEMLELLLDRPAQRLLESLAEASRNIPASQGELVPVVRWDSEPKSGGTLAAAGQSALKVLAAWTRKLTTHLLYVGHHGGVRSSLATRPL